MNIQKDSPDTARIEDYRQQMLDMYRDAIPPSPNISVDSNWLETHYPEPDIEKDKALIAASPSSSEPIPPPVYVGYLRVYTFTANGAEPIQRARVIITQSDVASQSIYANLTTDRDGFTPTIFLPSVDPALTLRPGTTKPYVAYNINVTADGFQPVEHRNVPIYGDNYVTQPIALLPLIPGYFDKQTFVSNGPTNL